MRKSFFMRAASLKRAGPAWTRDGGRLRTTEAPCREELSVGVMLSQLETLNDPGEVLKKNLLSAFKRAHRSLLFHCFHCPSALVLVPGLSSCFLRFSTLAPPPLSHAGLIYGDEGERRMGKTGTFMAELGAISPPCARPCSSSSQY